MSFLQILRHYMKMTQNKARHHRKWTVHDQSTAEVAAACGCSLYQIAKILNRTPVGVSYRLHAEKAKNNQNSHSKWRNQNKEKIAITAKNWKDNNKEKTKQADREWARNNPEIVRELSRKRRARKRNAINSNTSSVNAFEIQKIINYFNHSCSYCGSKDNQSIDHMVPLARGGIHELSNLIPACKKCNSSKCASSVEQWYKSQTFFNEPRWLKIQRYRKEGLTNF